MTDLYEFFVNRCRQVFRFLVEEYGCAITSVREYGGHGVAVTYKNQTTAVEISLEPRENRISVYLVQLVDGRIPPYLQAPSSWFYLDELISFRSPSSEVQQKAWGDWLTLQDIESILRQYADALRRNADDVLRGNFTVFVELQRRRTSESGTSAE